MIVIHLKLGCYKTLPFFRIYYLATEEDKIIQVQALLVETTMNTGLHLPEKPILHLLGLLFRCTCTFCNTSTL